MPRLTDPGSSRPTRRFVITALLIMIAGAAGWSLLPLDEWLRDGRIAVVGLGLWGIILFVTVYAVAVVVFAPATPFTIVAGALYGLWGVPISLAGAWVGALVSFALARGALRARWAFLCSHRELSDALDRAVTALGWKAVLLVRLSPLVPFSLQNYLFGMTGVNWSAFVLAGLVGMVPATVVKALLGSIGTGQASESGWFVMALGVLGVGATVLATVVFAKRVRAELESAGLKSRR